MALLVHTGRDNLTIRENELVSILGAPGSGKSNLALELAFLARPVSGQVLFHGKDPMRRKRRWEMPQRPRAVTCLVQNAEDQLFARAVFDDVAFGPRHLRVSEEEIEERVLRALTVVGLDPWEVRDRSPFALSGGERRRVALAGVLAMEPEVLVLDEPTANLDPQTRNEFLSLLTPLRGRTAIVWLTASAREASQADRIYVLRENGVLEVQSGDRLLVDWRELAQAGIELPALYDLAVALEKRGFHLPPAESSENLQAAIVETWMQTSHDR